MNPNPPNPRGWFESLRRIGTSLQALVRCRLELFTVEWQEEKLRLLNLLFWLGLAAVLGLAGVFLALTALAFWLWTVAGYFGLIGLAAATIAAALGVLLAIRKKIMTGPPPFSQTLAELRKDGECLRGNH